MGWDGRGRWATAELTDACSKCGSLARAQSELGVTGVCASATGLVAFVFCGKGVIRGDRG
jgi:hypothetical protein